jgi:flagellar biosynthesis anti-sigma factor FlgM
MKINPIINPNVLRSYQANKPGLEKTQSVAKRDELSLSKEAVSFSKALAEAKDAIEFRTPDELAHIANIKQAVSQGQYKIDSDLIAARIVDELGL